MTEYVPMIKEQEKETYPLVSAITDKEWTVKGMKHGEGPHADMSGLELVVPLTCEQMALNIRAHEQGHIAFSPVKKGTAASNDYLNMAEDARVNTLLTQRGVDLSAGMTDPIDIMTLVANLVKKRDRASVVQSMICTISTGDHKPFIKALKESGLDSLNQEICNTVFAGAKHLLDTNDLKSYRTTEKVAAYVEKYVKALEEQDKRMNETNQAMEDAKEAKRREKEREKRKESVSSEEKERTDAKWEKARMERKSAERDAMQTVGTARRGFSHRGTRSLDRWGHMVMDEPPRSESFPTRIIGRKHRPYAEGAIIRYPHRYAIDMSVFKMERTYPSGSVLIDGSGSMSFSGEDIESIVKCAPAAIIGVYSAGAIKINREGTLRILVKNQRRVVGDKMTMSSIHTEMGGSNVCDGPALDWLGQQPFPRIWVSDGEITGMSEIGGGGSHGEDNTQLRMDVTAKCAKFRIVRLNDVEEAIQYFTYVAKIRR